MDAWIKGGRFVFALSMVGFGALYLLYAIGVKGPIAGPPWTPGPVWLAWLAGAGLMAAGVCLATGWKAQLTAMLLGVVLFLRVLLLHAPGLAAHLHDPDKWTTMFEVLAMCAAAIILAGALPTNSLNLQPWYAAVRKTAEVLFAVSLVVFAVQHLMYARFVATLVPAWIPAHLFWAHFTALAFIAAALSIATNRIVRLSSTLLGVMFFLWVVLLHVPRVLAAPRNGDEWTSAFVALAMCGASFILVGASGSGLERQTGL